MVNINILENKLLQTETSATSYILLSEIKYIGPIRKQITLETITPSTKSLIKAE